MKNPVKIIRYGLGVITAISFPLFAYEEWSTPGLTAPTALNPLSIEAQYQHQFWGRIIGKDRPSNLFGIGEGADAYIGLRSVVWRKAQAYVSYDSRQLFRQAHNEFTFGVAYALFIPQAFLRLQAEGEIYSYASYLTYPEERKTGYFIRGCLQNDPVFDRVSFLCNVGYGFDEKKPGLGIGCNVAITEMVEVYGTYFPVWDKTDNSILQTDIRNPFSFGVKIITYGHQFFIFAGNATEIGSRHLMRGTSDNYLRLGFMIKRLFPL